MKNTNIKLPRFQSDTEPSGVSSTHNGSLKSSISESSVGLWTDGTKRVSLNLAAVSRRESDDGDFDLSYPSARALQTRTTLRRHESPLEPVDDDSSAIGPGKIERSQSHGSIQSDTSSAAEAGIDFLKDPPQQMTIGRRIALKLLERKWYNPRAGPRDATLQDDTEGFVEGSNAPSLKKAWAYFEHVILTRYVVGEHNQNVDGWGVWAKIVQSFKNFDEEFLLAQPGEKYKPTKLYDPITTPHRELGDFGLGFGLYFSTLRAIGYILFAAGCISVFNIYFFASKHYIVPGSLASNPILYGSAICTDTSWEFCFDCQCNNATQGWDRTSRCAETDTGLTWIQKNNCLQTDGAMRTLALSNYSTMMFLIFSIFGLGYYLKRQTIAFDEDKLTAQDYSILIGNPPPKASDPDVWRRYFETNFPGVRCAAITCAVNNDLLVRALVARREVLRMLELQLHPGTPMDIDYLALLAAKAAQKDRGYFRRLWRLVVPGLPQLLSRLVSLNTSIKGLAQLSYPCTKVFVTFERESHQREVLRQLSVGAWHIQKNNAKVLNDERYLFEGKVLKAVESVEPNSVRWQDLNATRAARMDQQLITSVVCFGIIVAGAQIVNFADQLHYLGAAFCIAAFNLLFPALAKSVVNLESHPNESKLQMSLYWKIALFRWVNTAMVITVITPFTHTLSLEEGLIPQIYSIFFAEIVTTNAIQMTDVWGHFQRHVLAPRASSQDSMNIRFQGLEVELAERYTNMTKIMFLAFWYCSIFPSALLLAAAALLINYYTDKFSLMRTWKRAPHVSTEISTYSRHYFFSSALVFLAAMSSFYWSAYPFDNMCIAANQTLDVGLEGVYTVTIAERFKTSSRIEEIELRASDTLYKFCDQDFILGSGGTQYPFLEGEWMDEGQHTLATLFAWTSLGVIVMIATKFLVSALFYCARRCAVHTYKEEDVGDDQGIDFHDVRNIAGFIPQVRSPIFSYPLIACKCDKIGDQLYDWTDPDRDHTYYDLTKDADHVLTGFRHCSKHSFSRIKHYPPNPSKSIRARKRALERRIERNRSIFNSMSLSHCSGEMGSLSMHSRATKSRNSSASRNSGETGDQEGLHL